jgi:hypothetical protein
MAAGSFWHRRILAPSFFGALVGAAGPAMDVSTQQAASQPSKDRALQE